MPERDILAVCGRTPLTLSERLILRAWMREYNRHRSTETAWRVVAEGCGVSVGRVVSLIHRSTFEEREACNA